MGKEGVGDGLWAVKAHLKGGLGRAPATRWDQGPSVRL